MIAYIALFLWPVIMIWLFRARSPTEALIWSLVGAYLLLPPNRSIDLPFLPPIGKNTLPPLVAMVVLSIMVASGKRGGLRHRQGAAALNMDHVRPGWIPTSRIIRLLLLMLVFGTVMTGLTNGDVQVFGSRVLQPLRPYDTISTTLLAIFGLLPLLLARKFLGHPDAHAQLIWVLCMVGLFYSMLALYEVRMSPQLNRMVYGFHAHNWVQAWRSGGYRPPVFLGHGLLVAIVLVLSTLAAAGCMRIAEKRHFWRYAAAMLWLVATVVLVKSLGALMILLMLLPMALFLNARLQMLFAAGIAGIVLLYPLLRSLDMIPVNAIVEFARGIDQQRAGSLAYRIANEDILLDRANQRPLFGWGGWARSRVFDEFGRDISVTDGLWVIYFGVGGWFRYLSEFGLMVVPMILLAIRRRGDPVSIETSLVSLILVANLIDMIPNSSTMPITSLLAGALIGRLEYYKVTTAASEDGAATTTARQSSPYSRIPWHPPARERTRTSRDREPARTSR